MGRYKRKSLENRYLWFTSNKKKAGDEIPWQYFTSWAKEKPKSFYIIRWKTVHIDLLRPLKKIRSDNRHILGVIDSVTKFILVDMEGAAFSKSKNKYNNFRWIDVGLQSREGDKHLGRNNIQETEFTVQRIKMTAN